MTGPAITRRSLTRSLALAAGGLVLAAAQPRAGEATGPELVAANFDVRSAKFDERQLVLPVQATSYTVQQGDTLWSIAAAHGLPHWQPIFDSNRHLLNDPNLLHIGMELVIPTAGEAVPPATDPAPAPPPARPTGTAEVCGFTSNWVTDTIIAAADAYGQSACEMLGVAWCESRHTPTARNARSGASGLFQFLPSTWRTTPYASSSIFNAWANAHAAGWMFSVGRRNEWVCVREGLVSA